MQPPQTVLVLCCLVFPLFCPSPVYKSFRWEEIKRLVHGGAWRNMLVTQFDKVCSILPPPHYSQDAALQWHKSFHHEAHVCWTQQFAHGRWISLALQQALLQWCHPHYVSFPSLSSVHHVSHKQTLSHPAGERLKTKTNFQSHILQ